MQGKILEDLSRSQTEFERFMANEDRQREVEFHNSKMGKWWEAFLYRRWAKAVSRLRRMGKDPL